MWLLLTVAAPSAATTDPGEGDATTGGAPVATDLAPCPDDPETVAAGEGEVRIIKLSGLLDPVLADDLLSKLDAAEESDEVLGLILWVNSNGSILDDDRFVELADRLRSTPLQIGFWVGQTGSTAQGGTAELATVADLVGVTPNSTIGNIGTRRLPAEWGRPFGEAGERMNDQLLTADEAVQSGVSLGPLENVVLVGSFATEFEGFEVLRCADAVGQLQTIPVTRIQISGLTLSSQLFHTVASPEVAYLFLILGLSLLLFELYTAGIGVAGILGAGFLALGCYGIAALPVRPWALILLMASFLLMAVDVQTNVPRFYTIIGLVAFTLSSWFLYDGVSMSWVTFAVGVIGAVLYCYSGMPSMVRTRFSTPTIGRKWMIGEMGEAVSSVDPDGTVKIRDAVWRATTNRATPVEAGSRVRVVGIDNLTLEIEPEEGGARDYRERG
jgi:membrane-bound serine protease (ClpP class)